MVCPFTPVRTDKCGLEDLDRVAARDRALVVIGAKKRLSRGSVTVHIKATATREGSPRINPEALRNYRSEIEALSDEEKQIQ